MAPPRTVLLDIDGTLLDSNDAHASAWKAALAEVGVHVSLGRLRRLIGMGGDRLLAELGLSEVVDPGKRAAERKKEIFRQRLLPALSAFPGARALVERMALEGLDRVVATSAGVDEVKGLLERAGVEDLVQCATSADEVAESKPAPDVVATALQKIGARPEEAVLIGDTPYDLEAARRAGVRMIALRCGGWDFADGGPAEVYEDPIDLLTHWEQSLLAA